MTADLGVCFRDQTKLFKKKNSLKTAERAVLRLRLDSPASVSGLHLRESPICDIVSEESTALSPMPSENRRRG